MYAMTTENSVAQNQYASKAWREMERKRYLRRNDVKSARIHEIVSAITLVIRAYTITLVTNFFLGVPLILKDFE